MAIEALSMWIAQERSNGERDQARVAASAAGRSPRRLPSQAGIRPPDPPTFKHDQPSVVHCEAGRSGASPEIPPIRMAPAQPGSLDHVDSERAQTAVGGSA